MSVNTQAYEVWSSDFLSRYIIENGKDHTPDLDTARRFAKDVPKRCIVVRVERSIVERFD